MVLSRFFGKKRSHHSSSNISTTSKPMTKEERNKLWDQKIAEQQDLARAEDRAIEEEERRRARAEKIKQRDEQILRELKELDRKGTEAAKKLTKTGKKAAKGFAKDMWHATKVAAKGLGDWADRVAPDEKPTRTRQKAKPKTTARKTKTIKPKTIKIKKPVKLTGNKRGLPAYAIINKKRYERAGTFGEDIERAQNYATQLRANGLDAKVKKMSNGTITIWTVWYRAKTTVKRHKRTNNSWC